MDVLFCSYISILVGCGAYFACRSMYSIPPIDSWTRLLTDVLVAATAVYSVFIPGWHVYKLIGCRSQLKDSVNKFCLVNTKLADFKSLCKKIIRFVQEAELVARGFTL